MARMKQRPQVIERPQALVASAGNTAQVVGRKDRKRKAVRAQAWQARAWEYYDEIGELRYATSWFSNALSRAELFVKDLNTGKRMEKGPAVEVLGQLKAAGEARLLKLMGQHYFVPGEYYLIGRTVEGTDSWDVYSTAEVKHANGKWTLHLGDSVHPAELSDDDAIIRIWTPHPRRHGEPDSPVRAVLGDLEEVRLLTAHIRAQIMSRLAGAGILVLPQEMSFTPPPNQSGSVVSVNSADDFVATLSRVMSTPIANPEDPSAIVPIVIQAPAEVIGDITHLRFWSDLDEEAATMREKAIARLALGLDLPPEILTGTGEVNHWGAWSIEESTIKAHIEPALDLIVSQLTIDFLRPALDGLEGVDPGRYALGHDTAKLRLRPNRSQEAIELYDRGQLSPAALLREVGFEEGDAPNEEDRKRFILMNMARGSATPEMVVQAAELLGLAGLVAEGDNMREARPAPSLENHPTNEIPQDNRLDASTIGACHVLVLRAMERAGNKIKHQIPKANGVAAGDLYRHVKVSHQQIPSLLEDAFSMLPSAVPGSDIDWVSAGLERYADRLLRTQEPVDRAEMLKYLTKD